ncbi:MAG: amidase, partial [Cyanobacteriota bacterium]|nr:amidase [Cyanobacteriota bacterium]
MNRSVRAVRSVVPWVVFPLLAAAGCRAQDVRGPMVQPPAPVVPTHRSVPKPPSARNAVLWVSLDDHLGRGTMPDRSASPLILTTAGAQPLQLQDWAGKPLETADTLRFSWRLVALTEPLE